MKQIRLEGKRVRKHCLQSIEDYVNLEGFEFHETPDGQFYLYKDNGANVLAVAHLDTVAEVTRCICIGERVWSLGLDDRLGAYIILEVLPTLGIVCDILLTVGEESCRSTAAYFNPPKAYNWVVEFDRGGEDVVTYQYANAAWHEALQSAGAKIGLGCYSDIAELYFLGVSCVNFGCGYRKAHTTKCSVDLRITRQMVAQFADFYWRYYETKFACDAGPSPMVYNSDAPPALTLTGWEQDILHQTFDEWRMTYDPTISREQWLDLYDDVELSQLYDYCDGCNNLHRVADMWYDNYRDLMYCPRCDARQMYSAAIVNCGWREGVTQKYGHRQ